MHKLDIVPHQTLHVPPGTLHAIGEGVMIVELQDPEDVPVPCEWVGFDVAGQTDGHLGLGFPTALTAVDCQARTGEQAQKWVTPGQISKRIFAPESCQYFRLERCQVSGSISTEHRFAIMVVLGGKLSLVTSGSGSLELLNGSTVVIPHGDGELRMHGDANVLIARPPQWR